MKKIFEFQFNNEDKHYKVETSGTGNLIKATVYKKKKFFKLFPIYCNHYWADDHDFNLEEIAKQALAESLANQERKKNKRNVGKGLTTSPPHAIM